ncbi:MAG: Smr/MutS family protein, partial [Fusobacteriaceae bacterium]
AMVTNIKEKTDELDKLRLEISSLKAETEREKLEYDKKIIELEENKNLILKEAYEKADQMIKEIQDKAMGLIEKIQKEDSNKDDLKDVKRQLSQIRSGISEDKKSKIISKPNANIKLDFEAGHKVYIKSLNQHASVIKINSSKGTAIIQSGILKMELPLSDMKAAEPERKKTYISAGSHSRSGVKYEIDLRGKMVDEAIIELESYLDRATLSGYNDVYVIHGKGTGALRDGLLKYFKTCRYVKSFRIGNHDEGGLGCTVVTLK